MKKLLILLLAMTLSACSFLKKDDVNEETTENEETNTETQEEEIKPVEHISISEVDFTQSQAEVLFKLAMRQHCGDTACTMETCGITGGDIAGTYSYVVTNEEGEEETVYVDVVLKDVTVSSENHSIAFFGENYFSDDEVVNEEGGESGEGEEGEESIFEQVGNISNYKYDLPSEVTGDIGLFDELLRNGTEIVYRVNLANSYLKIYGDLGQDGYFKATLLDLNQKNQKEFINATQAGSYEGSIEVDPGVYYLVIDTKNFISFYWTMIR